MAKIGRVSDFNPQGQKPSGKGGGSAPTPQTQRMNAGSAKATSSAPRNAQKLRG